MYVLQYFGQIQTRVNSATSINVLLNSTVVWKQCHCWCTYRAQTQGRKRKIFHRGQSNFSWFFPGVKCLFPVENSHFGRSKTNFSGFEKWKKRKRKGPLLIFLTIPPSIFNFPPSLFRFSFFSAPFSLIFLQCLSFPGRSEEIFPVRSLWGTLPPPPPPVTPLHKLLQFYLNETLTQLIFARTLNKLRTKSRKKHTIWLQNLVLWWWVYCHHKMQNSATYEYKHFTNLEAYKSVSAQSLPAKNPVMIWFIIWIVCLFASDHYLWFRHFL